MGANPSFAVRVSRGWEGGVVLSLREVEGIAITHIAVHSCQEGEGGKVVPMVAATTGLKYFQGHLSYPSKSYLCSMTDLAEAESQQFLAQYCVRCS